MPEPARLSTIGLACHAYSDFKVLARFSGQNKKGLASPGPFPILARSEVRDHIWTW